MFPDPTFWLTMVVTYALMVLPIILLRLVRDLILYPKFNCP